MKNLFIAAFLLFFFIVPSCHGMKAETQPAKGAAEKETYTDSDDPAGKVIFYFFHSEYCPHCRKAQPFVAELEKKYSDVEFRKLEVSHDAVNRALFDRKLKELGIKGGGVPLFVCGKDYVIGYTEDFEQKIEDLIVRKLSDSKK